MDASALRMGFPTSPCSGQLPRALVKQAEKTYRARESSSLVFCHLLLRGRKDEAFAAGIIAVRDRAKVVRGLLFVGW
jgi:hypothetical protein